MNEILWIITVPFTFAILSSWVYLKKRSSKKKPRFIDGFIAWILFLVFAFIGEVFARVVYPAAYIGMGDSPTQVVGVTLSIFSSMLIIPLLYISFRIIAK